MLRGSERQRHTRQLHRLKDALARRLETRLPGDANSEAPQGGWEGSEASIPPVPVAAEGDEEPKGSLARQGAAAHLQGHVSPRAHVLLAGEAAAGEGSRSLFNVHQRWSDAI